LKSLRTLYGLLFVFAIVACSAGSQSVVPASSGSQGQDAGRTAAAEPHFNVKPIAAAVSQPGDKTVADATGNLVDPGFESGGYVSWTQCGTVNARIATYRPHTGSYSDLNGSVSAPEINGTSGVCQAVKVPTGGKITFWTYEGTNETSTTYAGQRFDLVNSAGTVLHNYMKEASNTQVWTQRTYDVSAYAGQTVYLEFSVYGDGYSTGNVYQYVDDVAWTTGGTSTPAPTPTPTAGPTGSPTHSPSPTPTKSPTPAPTATPTPSGGPTPIATPTGQGSQSCGTTCGVERWHIKTLDDAYVNTINWTPTSISVSTLAAAAVPTGYSSSNDTTRYAPYETHSYIVRAILVGWKTETDHDFHIVIADPNAPTNTMIIEPPDLTCSMACASGFGSYYSSVRAKMVACFGTPPSSFTNFPSGVVVDVTGVAFFDPLHGQTGVAPNGIELHPLLSLKWVSGQPSGCSN
jgi:hypothetical protein